MISVETTISAARDTPGPSDNSPSIHALKYSKGIDLEGENWLPDPGSNQGQTDYESDDSILYMSET
jgi:hypothetical protein